MKNWFYILLLAMAATGTAAAEESAARKLELNIPAQAVGDALNQFGRQSGLVVMMYSSLGQGMKSPSLVGSFTPAQALDRLLTSTGLVYEFIDARTVAIRSAKKSSADTADSAQTRASGMMIGDLRPTRVAAIDDDRKRETAAKTANSDESTQGVPEILVKGKRSLNTDIKRSEDAPQPYVVFENQELQRSQATNLEEFLRTRLPMNTAAGNVSQGDGTGSSNPTSRINLRGLGINQTLILVDGRRMPSLAQRGAALQADISGIPLAAVERIEVLPSTAGGIYGGSATGGVVNIVLRRDFRGLEARVNYANSFDTDAALTRFDLSGGFALEEGRTQIMISATRSEANELTVGDRDFASRGIALQLRNNPNAILGSTNPPIGGTVNIRAVSGNLVLDPVYGSRALNSNITHLPLGYAGPASDNGAALVANAGKYNLDLPNDLNGRYRGLLAAPEMESASLNLRREFTPRIEAFLDFSRMGSLGTARVAGVPNLVPSLPASAPNNPFQQAIVIRFPTPNLSIGQFTESTTLRATGGLIVRLPGSWTGELDYSWNRSRSESIGASTSADSASTNSLRNGLPAPDGRPALNALQEGNTFPIDFSPYLLPIPNNFGGPYDTLLKMTTLRLSGPTFALPAGPVNFSALLEYRAEGLQDAFFQGINVIQRIPAYTYYPLRTQDAGSAYIEARAPLVSAANRMAGVRDLELQVSVRHDRYRTRSDATSATYTVDSRDGPFPALNYATNELKSTDFTFGLRYQPAEDVTFRASFGTGFLPPSVGQIAPERFDVSNSLGTDPKRGNTSMYVGVPFVQVFTGNPDLRPEKSRSVSAGVILNPRWIAGLRLSLDYTSISKIDEIQQPSGQFILDNEDLLPGRIVRGPKLASDPASWAGPITLIDQTYLNIARTDVRAWDLQADYTLDAQALGEFHWYAIATWQPHYRNRTFPANPVIDSAGYAGGPLELRGNLGLDWNRGPLSIGWNGQFYDAYRVYTATASASSAATAVLNQGSAMIRSQMYHDLIVSYRLDAFDADVSLGIQNIFDTLPPALAITTPVSAGYSTYGDPRLRRYSVSVRKSFGR